jgi:5-methylcytosine-specific restriction endonuclease McrBC GTP-binding regulatory subunit McrB
VQDISALVILAGISGTGKSELPQRYADYIGAQKLTLAVQPRWDSPQDLQGFYNYIEKKYKPTDLMRGLYQYQHQPDGKRRDDDDPMKDRLVMVLLDEMNLARVEYYFSDFLSKLETRRSRTTYLDLDVGSLSILEQERRLAIPQQFLFVGTMNEDETTQSLSDKVLDRANVLTFGKPQQLKLREEASNNTSVPSVEGYVSYSQFQGWMRKPDPDSEIVSKLRGYLDRANAIMNELGHPFAHRVYQAIARYVVNYPGVEGNEAAFNAALADQFGQKLLPKLRGLMLDECDEQLEKFSGLINDIGDRDLINAFATARKGHFGQFQWRGVVYLEESEQTLDPVGR